MNGVNMRALFLIGVVIAAVAFPVVHANAQEYRCFAKANPPRGFNYDVDILISPPVKGGVICVSVNRNRMTLATVVEVATYHRSDLAQKIHFERLLNQIKDQDVSGLSIRDLALVNVIEAFKTWTPHGDEVLVYRLFDGNRQIGGTVLISGRATACLPR